VVPTFRKVREGLESHFLRHAEEKQTDGTYPKFQFAKTGERSVCLNGYGQRAKVVQPLKSANQNRGKHGDEQHNRLNAVTNCKDAPARTALRKKTEGQF